METNFNEFFAAQSPFVQEVTTAMASPAFWMSLLFGCWLVYYLARRGYSKASSSGYVSLALTGTALWFMGHAALFYDKASFTDVDKAVQSIANFQGRAICEPNGQIRILGEQTAYVSSPHGYAQLQVPVDVTLSKASSCRRGYLFSKDSPQEVVFEFAQNAISANSDTISKMVSAQSTDLVSVPGYSGIRVAYVHPENITSTPTLSDVYHLEGN